MKKNKILQNYLPSLDLVETQKATALFKKLLIENLEQNLELIEVNAPLLSYKPTSTEIYEFMKSRGINFDSANNNGLFYIYNNYECWMRNTLTKLKLNNNFGIFSFLKYIQRDVEITNLSSKKKNTISIEYHFSNEKLIYEKTEELTLLIYKLIVQSFKEVKNKFPKLDFNIPEKLNSINLKEYKFNNEKLSFLENELTMTHGLTMFKNEKNDSKKIRILFYSKELNESFEIMEAKARKTLLEMQESSNIYEDNLENYNYFKENLLENIVSSINIEINFDLLMLLLLKKAHIFEIQSCFGNKEFENYFKDKKIKSL